jgi:hypothetical protein
MMHRLNRRATHRTSALTPLLVTVSVCWTYSTEAATRPNRERCDVSEFPFSGLALAIRAGNGRNGDCDPLNSGEKMPVPAGRGNYPRRAAMEYSLSCQGDTAC